MERHHSLRSQSQLTIGSMPHTQDSLVKKQEQHICACGKAYSCFSALTLHVKLKHENMYVTQGQGHFSIEQTQNKIVLKYALREGSYSHSANQQNCQMTFKRTTQKNQNMRNMSNEQKIHFFLQHCKSRGSELSPHFTTFNLILTGFKDYLYEIEILKQKEPELKIPEDFILLFNQFVTYYVPQIRKNTSLASFKKSIIAKIMLQFGIWLKQRQLTEYTIVQNLICQYKQNDKQKTRDKSEQSSDKKSL